MRPTASPDLINEIEKVMIGTIVRRRTALVHCNITDLLT